MDIIKAKYLSTEAFLDAFLSDTPYGGLFIPTRAKHQIGKQVVVYIRFPGLRSKVLVSGTVAWRRTGKREPKMRAGLGIEFMPQERHTRDFLLQVASGSAGDPYQRRFRRLPVGLSVDWKTRTAEPWSVAAVTDIGMGGTFIETPAVMPVGSTVILGVLAPGGEQKIIIEGTVAWNSTTPAREGMGVEFRCRDLGGKRLVREIIRRLEGSEHDLESPEATPLQLN